MGYADDQYYEGHSRGYNMGKRHGRQESEAVAETLRELIRIKDGAIKILGDALAAGNEKLSERDATIKGLQQSLDEATARIGKFESDKKPFLKIGDRVRSKGNKSVPYYTVRGVNPDGTLNVQGPSGGLYRNQPADGFILVYPGFKPGDIVWPNGYPDLHYEVGEVNPDGSIKTIRIHMWSSGRLANTKLFSPSPFIARYKWTLVR